MGRGRAKAKQAKVARQLKYSSASTDLDALRKELLNDAPTSGDGVEADVEDDDEDEADDEPDNDIGTSYGTGSGR